MAKATKQSTTSGNVVSLKDRIRRRVDSLRNTFTGMGDDKVFAGRPDLYRQILTWQELTQLWRFNGLSRRYVEIVPNDATRKGWNVIGDDGEVEGIDEENKRLDVFAAVNEADTWGRLYGAAWLLIVTTDRVSPGAAAATRAGEGPLAAPLDPSRVISVDNLVVLDVSEASPVEYDTRLRSPTFREPLRYVLNLTSGSPDGMQAGTVVHASRMLYFPGQRLPPSQRYANGGIDDSILQSVWDQIRNSGQLEHALAVIANEIRISTLKMKDLADLELNDEAAYFEYRMREMAKHKSVLNTVLLGADEEYTHESGTVAGMAELTATTRQALQAVTGMPEQLWIGNAPGGLSTDGESHRNLWAQVVSSYQVTKYQPLLSYLYDLILSASSGPTNGVVPETWRVEFEPLDELTVKGKADLKKVTADTDAIYLDRGVVTAEQVAAGRFGPEGWKEQLPSADVLAAPAGLNMAAIEAALAGAGTPPAASGAATAPAVVSAATGDAPTEPQQTPAEALAAQMTEHGIERCEHGSVNRCWKCGIERERSLLIGPDGSLQRDPEGNAKWALKWTAIGDRRTYDGAAMERRSAPRGSGRMDETDADSVWIGLPLPPVARGAYEAARNEAAIRTGMAPQDIRMPSNAPHVTVLYVGKLGPAEAEAMGTKATAVLDDLLSAKPMPADTRLQLGSRVSMHAPLQLTGCGIGAFAPSPSSQGETVLYMGILSDALTALHRELSIALLTAEEREARPWFVPHATLGYRTGELTIEQWVELWDYPGAREKWEARTVELHVGDKVTRWSLGAR